MEQSPKNNQDFFYIISLLLITFVLVSLGTLYWNKDNIQEKKQNFILDSDVKVLSDQEIKELVDGPYEQTDEDRLVFNVSQNTDGPQMTKVIIAPQKVSRGQEQYLEVWVKDEQGVASVQTETELDGGFVKKIDMELFDGDAKDGKWRTKWVVHDTHDKTYNTKFMTASIDGRDSEITYAWLDPCSPPSGTAWSVNTNQFCDNTGIVGTDDNIIIADNVNLTVNATTLAFPPFRSITLGANNSSISLVNGATIEKAYMVIRDPDADRQYAEGASKNLITATTTSFDTRTINSATVQGKWIGGVWYTNNISLRIPQGGDCYEADTDGGRSTYSGNSLWYNVTNRGDGSWDYNCSGAIEYKVSAIAVNACRNTQTGYEVAGRVGEIDYFYYCSGSIFCGLKYLGGSSWSCPVGDSEPRDDSACNESPNVCTPSQRASFRH